MIHCLFVCEGSSDFGLSGHIERIAIEQGVEITITSPDFARLGNRVGASISAKLEAARRLGGDYDMVAVHRDADNAGHTSRRSEIADAVKNRMGASVHIAIVPVRMTEAWLILDERAIRKVAGNPNSRVPLRLPKPSEVEGIADPKALLKSSIATASGCTGRRLTDINRRFSRNRARLLETLSWDGPVKYVPSWRRFLADVTHAITS